MLIDWFTVGAQIVNFTILVLLLRHFLYGRIVKAIDDREASIVAKVREAEEDRQRALREADSYEEKIRSFDREYHEKIRSAEQEVREFRTRQIEQARSEVGTLREQWGEALARQRSDFMEELKRSSGQELCEIARRALADLADSRLEEQAVRVFVDRLSSDPEPLAALREAIGESPAPVTVSSSFAIEPDLQESLKRGLQKDVIGDREVLFEEDPELSWGITLRAESHVLEWTMDAWVDELARHFQEEILAESRGARLVAELEEDGGERGVKTESKPGEHG